MDDVAAHSTNLVDDFYFSALAAAEEDLYPISDEKYADELQLQEVLVRSSSVAAPPNNDAHAPSPASAEAGSSTSKTGAAASSSFRESEAANVGKDQSESLSFCKICMDTAPSEEMFRSSNACSHSFCRNCLSRHIAAKVQENIHFVRCPEINCTESLEPELCQGLIPAEVFERWQTALCEAFILSLRRTYCPFKDCSEPFIVDDDAAAAVTQAVCPSCTRLFCSSCESSWHSGVTCEEFRRLGADERQREDLLLIEVAKNNSWKRCPRCKFYVEKTQGCMHIVCRCTHQFCYRCGSQWTSTHGC